mgnify:FL=1
MRKIVFLTGTRADYGKIKSLLKVLSNSKKFDIYIYVTGMHMLSKYGNTYIEILKDGFTNVYLEKDILENDKMDIALSDSIKKFSNYIDIVKPDLIVVHGDRVDALAGVIVGAFNNIRIAHIEGGEISGTIDESTRHAISKFAQFHFVANEEAKKRLIQMGENSQNIYVIGSPDIDIMLSDKLPTLEVVKDKYDIRFDKYAIVMYHPVTTEISKLEENVNYLVSYLANYSKNYIIIYPNNDLGSNIILNAYKKLEEKKNIKIFPSIRFEMFLTLLKNCDFLIGNSSAGIRECGVYGIPAINIGSRQSGRFNIFENKNIINIEDRLLEINEIVDNIDKYRIKCCPFGKETSCEKFIKILETELFWNIEIQKKFNDLN